MILGYDNRKRMGMADWLCPSVFIKSVFKTIIYHIENQMLFFIQFCYKYLTIYLRLDKYIQKSVYY